MMNDKIENLVQKIPLMVAVIFNWFICLGTHLAITPVSKTTSIVVMLISTILSLSFLHKKYRLPKS